MVELASVLPNLLTQSLPFSAAIKFDRLATIYASPVVNGTSTPIAFTVDTTDAMPGAVSIVKVMSNGSNTPTFTSGVVPIKVLDGGSWDPRSGILNILQLIYFGAGDVWVSITQEANATPADIAAPTLVSAVIPNSAPSTVVLTFSETLSGTAPAASAFAVSGNTVSSVAMAGAVVTLTVGTAFTSTSTGVTVSYTKPGTNPLRDAADNGVATFTGQPVTNNVALATIPLTFPVANRLNISNTGTDYTNTGGVWGGYALSDKVLPANADGWVEVTQPNLWSAGGSIAFGFKKANTNGNYNTIDFGVYPANTDGRYNELPSAAAIAGSPLTVANQRFRIKRTGGVITAEHYNGSSWIVVKTWTENYQGALYIQLVPTFTSSSIARDPVGFGVV